MAIAAGIDTATDPRAPRHSKVTEPDEVTKTGLAYLHTAHCLGSGDIMVRKGYTRLHNTPMCTQLNIKEQHRTQENGAGTVCMP